MPSPVTNSPRTSSRRSRDARSGAISTATRRRAALSFRDRRTCAPCLAGYDGERADRGPDARRAAGYHAASVQPSAEQLESYARDGFLVVERWLEPEEVERLRERFHRCFAHEWATGLRPTKSTTSPAPPRRDVTRQLCNVWKADRTMAATVSPPASAASRARSRRARHAPGAGQRDLEAPVGQGAAVPSGRRVPAVPRSTEHDHLLDGARRYARRYRHDLLRARFPSLAARGRGGKFHAPEDWLGHVASSTPPGSTSLSWSRSRSPRAAPPSTMAGRSTAAPRTSERTPSGDP